jgi:hypothetical protein
MSRMSGHAASGQHKATVVDATRGVGVGGAACVLFHANFWQSAFLMFRMQNSAGGTWILVDAFQKFQGRVLSFGPSRYALAAQPELQDRVAKGMVFTVEDLYIAIQHRFTSSPCQAVRGVNLLITGGERKLLTFNVKP